MEIPGYDIQAKLGSGAMATVFLAVQKSLARKVALKVMTPDLGQSAVFCQRFLQEGEAIAKLNHPHIVKVYDIGVSKQNYYMALEYAERGALSEAMQSKGLTLLESVEIIKRLADALQCAHSQHIVHRDVKPGNVLIRGNRSIMLSDFGIAKSLQSNENLTQAGVAIGTPTYMSPEQISGLQVSPQSDLYSLGILFYEMLVGQRPYRSKNTFTLAVQHQTAAIPRLPMPLVQFQPIIDTLLAKKPHDRFLSATDLIDALNQIGKKTLVKTQTAQKVVQKKPIQATQRDDTQPFVAPSAPGNNTKKQEKKSASSPSLTVTIKFPDARKIKIFALSLALLLALGGGGGWLMHTLQEKWSKEALSSLRIKKPIDILNGHLKQLQETTKHYQTIRILDPNNAVAHDGLQAMAKRYEALARQSRRNFGKASSLAVINSGLSLLPKHTRLLTLKKDIEKRTIDSPLTGVEKIKVVDWLRRAEHYMASSHYVLPIGGNALDLYRKVLVLQPNNPLALAGKKKMVNALVDAAHTDLAQGRVKQAISSLELGLLISPYDPELANLSTQVMKVIAP